MNERIEDRDIQEAMRMSLVSEEPSENLLRNLRVMAKEAAPRKRRLWRPGLALAGTVAAGVIIASLSMLPTKASAKTFELIEKAAQKVRTFRFSIDSSESGNHEFLTIAGADGRFTMRTNEGLLMRFDASSLSFYDPKENVVTSFKLGGLVDLKQVAKQVQSGLEEGFDHMDLKKMLKDYRDKYGKDQIQISAVTSEGGKDVYHVTMQSKTDPDRVEMLVDASTDLPEQIVVTGKERDGSWRQTLKMGMHFGTEIDPKELNVDFPASAKKVDIDLGALVGDAMKGVEAVGSAFDKIGKDLGKIK
ncbi:LolA family protein [Fimbriimonas ginsengisoli]|uniref:Uncharacterized protein n=1 Tax=Fimbriimonas ginsengisoli Gsoil 348 TaxID=661478 RepID=A0A068NTD1_FIMGI|nr:hypothetical protein [Fimbriimonas ginsengisoli]AIE86577.1 hypothetical protein OP10G_3209 [Fimbriimonas ginsengisoli Gsoil 348]